MIESCHIMAISAVRLLFCAGNRAMRRGFPLLLLLALLLLGLWQLAPQSEEPIRVGVLYSQSGTMAVSEMPSSTP